MDCHEPHPAPNEKTQPIQWTERPTGALVAVNSLQPWTLRSGLRRAVLTFWNLEPKDKGMVYVYP